MCWMKCPQRWQQRYGRLADDLPPRRVDPGEEPLVDLELWDLVSAFGRIIRESKGPPPAQVIYDDTPIHVHMKRVHELIVREGAVQFGELFEPAMHKSTLIGLFLARAGIDSASWCGHTTAEFGRGYRSLARPSVLTRPASG